MKTSEICNDEKRRDQVRAKSLNGLDYLEVSDDQLTLTVYFLGKAPEDVTPKNVRISGGRRIRDIRVVDIRLCVLDDPDVDDCMSVYVDKPGDYSTYTLCLVELDEQGNPSDKPFHGFDPRYACLDFSFKAGCPSDLDCQSQDVCPPEELPEPEISYLAKDYASFRQLILDRLALVMPDWQERHVPDIGITLVELLAYAGDYLSYYQDAVATEAYLGTARQRISVRRHARLVDYLLHEGCNARAWVFVEATADSPAMALSEFYFLTQTDSLVGQPVLAPEDLANIPHSDYEVFEPLASDPTQAVQFFAAHNRISFYTWGDQECCLPRGTTSATLKDSWMTVEVPEPENPSAQQGKPAQASETPPPVRSLHLEVGDVLIFEEVIGPKTGNPADADPGHRHAVRLTGVTLDVDTLYNQPVVEIEWAPEDALPFPLCLSAIGPGPACEYLEDISLARGNVVLVDHGRTIFDEPLGSVPVIETPIPCEGDCPAEMAEVPGLFRPSLQNAPLTFSQPLAAGDSPATGLLDQDPHQALPEVTLVGSLPLPAEETHWVPRQDLLASDGDEDHFVVEMDDDGIAHLRFGDGELGSQPPGRMAFQATYRVGNGPAGNVGAEVITHIALRSGSLSGVTLRPRNPMPAVGGTLPEPISQAKLFAPYAFRSELQRAIIAEDYAQIVQRDFTNQVQGSAASLCWTGSWYEVDAAVDQRGAVEADPALLDAVAGDLYRYRRIGHDLEVTSATQVPLDITLEVCVLPGYLKGHVEAALLEVFSNRVLPGGGRGFFHPDNLTFGEGITLSKLVAVAQAVPGVESVTVTQLERLYQGPNHELENGILPLGPLEVARLDNDPGFPENGQLHLVMGGGR